MNHIIKLNTPKIGLFFAICLIFFISSLTLALPPEHVSSKLKAYKPGQVMKLDTRTMININNLHMFCTNIGGFAEDMSVSLETGKADGLYYPAGTDRTVLYSGGVWIAGKVDNEIRLRARQMSTSDRAELFVITTYFKWEKLYEV